MKWLCLLCVYFILSGDCFAQNSPIQQSQAQPSDVQHSRGKKDYEIWGLNKEDWVAYKKIMRGSRGLLSPNLDPITALGVEVETQAERRRLAEIHVQFELHRVDKELAFQWEVTQAWKRLYPNGQLFDMKIINQLKKETKQREQRKIEAKKAALIKEQKEAGRLLFFTTINQCQECERVLSVLLKQVEKGRQLDIYLESAETDTQIRDWAKAHAIPAEQVYAHNITLNYERGRLGMISGFTGQVPYTAVKNGRDQYRKIALP